MGRLRLKRPELAFNSGKTVCVEKPQWMVAVIVVMAGTHTHGCLLSKWKQACCSNHSNLSPSTGTEKRDITNRLQKQPPFQSTRKPTDAYDHTKGTSTQPQSHLHLPRHLKHLDPSINPS